jgi:uncharacterized membrane protein (UPF0127 family)
MTRLLWHDERHGLADERRSSARFRRIRPCRGVHTIGMKFPIDVAFVDEDGVVVKTLQMARHRIGIPVFSARTVIEANAGAFARWGIRVGDVIEVREE